MQRPDSAALPDSALADERQGHVHDDSHDCNRDDDQADNGHDDQMTFVIQHSDSLVLKSVVAKTRNSSLCMPVLRGLTAKPCFMFRTAGRCACPSQMNLKV